MSTAPVSTAPVDRSLMEPGIMENRWCHLCPGGLGVWKRSVFVGVQSFCFTLKIISLGSPPQKPKKQRKQHVFKLVVPRCFFCFGRFWTHMGPPCGFIFSSWEAAGETHLQPFFGDQKRTKHGKLGDSVKRPFPKPRGVLVLVPFHEVPKLGKVRDRISYESKPNKNRWDGPNLRGILKQQKRVFFFERLKKSRDIGICELFFFRSKIGVITVSRITSRITHVHGNVWRLWLVSNKKQQEVACYHHAAGCSWKMIFSLVRPGKVD